MGKPDRCIALQVSSDGCKAVQVDLPGEAPCVPCEGAGKRGTSGNTRPSEALGVADEPVVVMYPKPMNPCDWWEDNTLGSPVLAGGALMPKALGWGEGAKKNRSE